MNRLLIIYDYLVPTLITIIGIKKNTYRILKDLCTPSKPEEKLFKEIQAWLQSVFGPPLPQYYTSERVKFNNRIQCKKINQFSGT